MNPELVDCFGEALATQTARPFYCRRARARFPELHRDAGRYPRRMARQWRWPLELAGSGEPCSGGCAEGAGKARRTRQGRRESAGAARMVQGFRSQTHGPAADAEGATRTGAVEYAFAARREVQPDIAASPRRCRPPGTDDVATLANCGFPAAADRRSAGEIRL